MTAADLARLFQEVASALTRADAEAIVAAADWVFVNMPPRERERAYERLASIIQEKT